VQVNTSGEASKFGVAPEDSVTLAQHIATACKNLKLAGLMTIGQPDYSSRPENFTCLKECRSKVAEALSVPEDSMQLSMGMSGDFEQAIEMGSTNVRVGSSIFGARDYSK
jgi:PLP dependent protein